MEHGNPPRRLRKILRYRINQSLSILINEDNNIIEVALKSCFQNSSYYCRIFKQYMNLTPTSYIKQMKEKNKK